MAGSDEFNIGVVDSGTTFTYVPTKLFQMLIVHFDWFCSLDSVNHCKGKRIRSDDQNSICFRYEEQEFPNGPKKYFMSYPVLNFKVILSGGSPGELKWYPSEYLFRHKPDQYCMALEKFSRSNEILMGGTFMRQNNYIFDVETNKIGVIRAQCNEDANMITDEAEMISNG